MIEFSSLGFSMVLGAWIFMVSLKTYVYKSKISLENGSETHELDVPSLFDVH